MADSTALSPPLRNPFRPTFGVSPTILAGRDSLLDSFRLGLAEGPGSPFRALLISGARGMGKTVLLNEFEEAAAAQGWISLRAYPDEHLVSTLAGTTIPQALAQVRGEPPRRMLTGGGIAGIGSITSAPHPDATHPTPTLITRLRDLAEHLRPYGTGVLITLDELQAAQADQLHQLATAVQDLLRDDFDIALVAAGLPEGIERLLQQRGTTFIRRAERIHLRPVADSEAREMFLATARAGGREMSAGAAEAATALSVGYPYLMQLTGSLAWAHTTLSGESTITTAQIDAIRTDVIRRMGSQVHGPSLHQVPDRELGLLYTLAELSPTAGMVSTGEVAAHLGVKPNALSMARKSLLERGLVEVPKYGYLSFSLPYLREYLLDSPQHRPIT
ncbi:AAA family ATPase [Corynebacterium sp. A21]|uniref:AAA family ATPase n=1 Tax=Corynebacterium sp. A21 TaxID=3457318 RepID=UPI003FD046F9